LLAFISVYFFELGLFNGLRPIQIKKILLFDLRLYFRLATAVMAQMRSFSSPPSRGATEPGELKNYSTASAFEEGFVGLTLRGSALIHQATL
jgi:hypothetical protein